LLTGYERVRVLPYLCFSRFRPILLAAYDEARHSAAESGDAAMVSDSTNDAGTRADELERRAVELAAAGDSAGALAAFEQAIGLTLDADDDALVARARRLLWQKAHGLAVLGDHQAAIAEYDRLVAAAERPPRAEQWELAEALGERARSLLACLRLGDAIGAFGAIVDRFGDDPDKSVRVAVGSAAFHRAVVMRDADRVADAMAAFDDVVRRYGADPEPEVHQWAALAMFNKAGLLADIGRLDEALDLYREVTTRFADSGSELARERAARAASQRAQRLATAGRGEEALAAYRDATDRFAGAPEQAIRVEAAGALLEMGALLQNQERADDGRAAAAEVEERFGDDPDPRLQELVAVARAMRAPQEQVSHAFEDALARSRHDELREDVARILLTRVAIAIIALAAGIAAFFLIPGGLAVRGVGVALIVAVAVALEWRWGRRQRNAMEYVQANLKHIEEAARVQATADEAARKVIKDFEETGQPYALYLRSFDIEVMRMATQQGSVEWTSPGTRQLEEALAGGLEGKLPILGIQNPADNAPYRTTVIPKFALASEGWQDGFAQLVQGAELIVMVPVAFSPGISYELSAILELGRAAETVVIVPGATGDEVAESIGLVTLVTGYDPVSLERFTASSPELASFPRVALEEDISFDALDSHALFADLLERVAFVAALPPADRREARDFRIARDAALRQLGSGDNFDILRELQICYRVAGRLGDRVGLIATLFAVGAVRYQAGDLVGAAGTLQDAARHCGEGDIVRLGSILRLLGACQRDTGDKDAAVSTLSRAVEALTAAGSRAELAETLTWIGEVFLTDGEPEPAVDPLLRAATLWREARNTAGLAQALAEAGSALVGAGQAPEAITALTESLELSRAAQDDPALTEREPLLLAMLAVAAQRTGADSEARSYAAAAQALPVSPDYADLVQTLLQSFEAEGSTSGLQG
jgi:tetratricopeptide (TPR) repeat protein